MAKKDKQVTEQAQQVTTTPVAVKVALAEQMLTTGPKAPKHRAGHNADAWKAISEKLPAKASELAAMPEVQKCGGPKANGALFLGYALRRGWLAVQAS